MSVPTNCYGCGSPFDVTHALDCKKGGLITQRHNEVRDATGDIAALAWGQVKREPIIKEGSVDPHEEGLVADLAIRGVWQPQAEALFDIHVTDTA